jgi:hypothetical protein
VLPIISAITMALIISRPQMPVSQYFRAWNFGR